MPDWLVIVNPNAGQGKGEKDWIVISNLLTKHGLRFHSRFTLTEDMQFC